MPKRHQLVRPPDTYPLEASSTDNDDSETLAILCSRSREQSSAGYDLERLFVEWAWFAGFRDWDKAVRALAHVLRGLEGAGLIERRAIRRVGRRPLHGLRLTPLGTKAVECLSHVCYQEAE